ncbi:MAG TPA: carboxymuconolactone decarboxylase family protein [Gemmatimonadales bacterium]|jgi:AhpD family alkylhydroperoxidase
MVRLNYSTVAPELLRAMGALQVAVRHSGLPESLIELIKLRASYANGCAYCVDMHTKDALAAGETAQRLFGVAVWHETPYFTPQERAALAWTDALTHIADGPPSDELFEEVSGLFTPAEVAYLTLAIVAINGWNRIALSLGADVGSYQVPAKG